MKQSELNNQALNNAVNNESTRNYAAIFDGFINMGIRELDIKPRVNIFTYKAWLAKGRQVIKGQHGIRVVTFVPMSKKDKVTGEKHKFSRPRTTTVFHISQTESIN